MRWFWEEEKNLKLDQFVDFEFGIWERESEMWKVKL